MTPDPVRRLADSTAVRSALDDHLRTSLVHDAVVGVPHQDATPAGTLAGAPPAGLPRAGQVRTRTEDRGREGLDARSGETWRRFAPRAEAWVDVVVPDGPDGLERVGREVAAGSSAPRTGHVVQGVTAPSAKMVA